MFKIHLFSIVQNRKGLTLKSTEELSVMTMMSYTKFEEELTCRFKVEIRNLTNFDPSTWKSQTFTDLFNVTSNWLVVWKKTWRIWQIFSRALKIGIWWDPLIETWKIMSLKSTKELSVMTLKNYAKFEEELTSRFKVDLRNLTNFDPSTWKSQKFSF